MNFLKMSLLAIGFCLTMLGGMAIEDMSGNVQTPAVVMLLVAFALMGVGVLIRER